MSELAFLVSQLESGSTDLLSCLSSRPTWSRGEQFQLVVADQRYRAQRGEPCSAEHYAEVLPWLADDNALQRELVDREFSLRLGSMARLDLIEEFEGRYSKTDRSLLDRLRKRMDDWNERPLSSSAFDALCDGFEDAIANGQTPLIEVWLDRAPGVSRLALLRELLLIESYHLARRGLPVDWEGYRRRFPGDCDRIDSIERQNSHTTPSPRRDDSSPGTRLGIGSDLSGMYVSRKTVGDLRNGRYRFERKLGQGSFGAVYLAQDMDLKRQVAVKVPSREALENLVDVDSYLIEAQTVAGLDHPNIVAVYDVGRTLDGSIYVVSKFIDGCSLADWIAEKPRDFQTIARLLELISEALHHAHQRRLIHRDIKPANILIDEASGMPYVADFGLAIREEDYLQEGRIVGSPAYMSPEQVLGEGHRLDGRSDLFSLGVVMYLMLTGRLPFPGQTREEVAHAISTVEPATPRSLKHDIPSELERICLKLLRKRASERYATGRELAEDLRAWLAPRFVDEVIMTSQKITPRGLRSFTADDASFFLDLLPGPRNRDGLPESIAFWKEKLEQRDPDQTFTVGLLYGPSGCGKSSLVKAGLIPRLSPDVLVLYVEATPDETETRLLRQLRKRLSNWPSELGLVESSERIRRSEGPKVVLIIDQFEQWLYAHAADLDSELGRTLRQCDGRRLQTVLMIRDDFYLAAARLMNQIDVPILTDQNFKLVDLFDLEHAKRVMTRFGESYDKLPRDVSQQTPDQQAFIHRVVEVLSENNKVVSVRLSLLADMLKGREWVPSTLKSIGGLEGVGTLFLEETFATSNADARHRAHQVAARGLLRALLPETGTDIKGSMRSEEELLEASGYVHRRHDFQDLMRILDGELRLLTPTDPEGQGSQPAADSSRKRFYQLTHDYMVPSLREWLTRKQRETKRGRAELKLSERAAAWSVNSESKQLPTLVEWFQIRRLTEAAKWKANEKAMMRSADRFHLSRALAGATLAIALIGSGLFIKQWNDERLLEGKADSLVRTIEAADFSKLEVELRKLTPFRSVVDPKLKVALDATPPDSAERLKLSLALLPSDPTQLDDLLPRLRNAQVSQIQLMIDQLRPHQDKILPRLWSVLEGENKGEWLPVASALADYDPNNARWGGVAPKVCHALVQENALRVSTWIELLRPAAATLIPELQKVFAETPSATRTQTQIDLATEILEIYAANDFSTLHELILGGRPEQFARLFNEYERFRSESLAKLRIDVAKSFKPESTASIDEQGTARSRWVARQANAAIALMRFEDLQPVYQFLTVERDPEALSQFIDRIRGREVNPSLLTKCFMALATLATPIDAEARKQHYLRLYGILLGVGEFSIDQLPAADRDGLVEQLISMYREHPSRAVHSALGWLLKRWGLEERVKSVDETPVDYDASGMREWYVIKVVPPAEPGTIQSQTGDDRQAIDLVAPIHFTLLVFPGGEFEMGDIGETETVRIEGPIAVSDREVTWRQFSPIDGDRHRRSLQKQYKKELGGRRLLPEEPVFGVNWFESVSYCRWLTDAFTPGEPNQSYAMKPLTPGQINEPGRLEFPDPKDWEWPMDPKRPGFRLLTEAEWEYIARGGMDTQYSFGTSEELLEDYGWYNKNSDRWSHETGTLRPSVGGLFDIHGNLWEWTDDWYNKGSNRVIRGGGWDYDAANCRAAGRRIGTAPVYRGPGIGFRIALVPSVSAGYGKTELKESDASGANEGRSQPE